MSKLKNSVRLFVSVFATAALVGQPLLQLHVPTAAAMAQPSDVWVSSAMPNPVDSDATGEYLVLENQTASTIDVTGWTIDDGGSAGVLSGNIPAAGSYGICRDTDPVTSTATVSCDEEWSGMSLKNSGDTITLKDGAVVVDQVSYTSSSEGEEVVFSAHVAAPHTYNGDVAVTPDLGTGVTLRTSSAADDSLNATFTVRAGGRDGNIDTMMGDVMFDSGNQCDFSGKLNYNGADTYFIELSDCTEAMAGFTYLYGGVASLALPFSGTFVTLAHEITPVSDIAITGATAVTTGDKTTYSATFEPLAADGSVRWSVYSGTNGGEATIDPVSGELTAQSAGPIQVIASVFGGPVFTKNYSVSIVADTSRPTTSLAIEPVNPTKFSVSAQDDTALAIVTGNIYSADGLEKSCSKRLSGTAEYVLQCAVPDLRDGTYNVRYNAKDVSGNMSTTMSIPFTIDTMKPAVAITSPASKQVLTSNSFTAVGTADDTLTDIARVEYTVNEVSAFGGTYVGSVAKGVADGTNNWTFDVANLDDGYYRLKVKAFDGAGNWRYRYHDVQVDTSKPVTVVNTADGQTYTSGDIVIDAVTTDSGAGITMAVMNLYDNDGLIQSCVNDRLGVAVAEHAYTCTLPVSSLEDGDYYLKINSRDGAGYTSNTVRWEFSVDTTAPQLSITQPSKVTIYSPGTIQVQGMADATVAGAVQVTLNGVVQDAYANAAGAWTATFNDVSSGQYAISATARDAFGNSVTITTDDIVVIASPASFVVAPVTPTVVPQPTQNPVVTQQPIAQPVQVQQTAPEGAEVLAEETSTPSDSDVKASEITDPEVLLEEGAEQRNFAGMAYYWWLLIVAIIVGAITFTIVRWRRSR